MSESLAWYVVLQATALAAWPLVRAALGPFDDRGWGVAKTVGPLGLAWLVWLLGMLVRVPFTRATLALVALAVGVAGWGWLVRRGELPALRAWLRERLGLLLSLEAVFLAGFVLFGLLRSHAPAIAGTEKPMDMAFLNGFLSADQLPTQDTWLAGYGVPYYHFGYFVLACLGKLAGVPPGVAYNLASASVPALAMVGLTGLAWSVLRAARVPLPWAAAGAALSVLLGLFASNLAPFFEFLYSRRLVLLDLGNTLGIKNFGTTTGPGVWPPLDGFWWFRASRVIPTEKPDGINEFPFFSALLADLHPHFVALPFELLVLSVGAAHLISRGETLRSPWTQALGALGLGGLLVINTWDIAPFWLLYVGLGLLGARYLDWRWRWAAAIATPFAGAMLFAPYFVGYAGPPLGLSVVTERTPFGSLLVLFGWAIVLLAAFGLFVRWCTGDRRGWQVAGGGAVAGVALALLGQPALGVLLALAAVLLPWPNVLERLEPPVLVGVAVAGFAAAMLLGVEIVFLDDVFHTRMNTVFKFHVNVWLLAALAAGLSLGFMGLYTRVARWLVAAVAACALAAGLVYPVTAIATRMAERPPNGPTLDGSAFLSPEDRAAVRWLAEQNRLLGTRAVIAEAVGDEYSLAGRMATFSGASAVLGWAGHELQWRGPLPELERRRRDMADLYRDAPPERIRSILDSYGARFVVVGDIERQEYGEGVATRFEGILPLGMRAGPVAVYRVT